MKRSHNLSHEDPDRRNNFPKKKTVKRPYDAVDVNRALTLSQIQKSNSPSLRSPGSPVENERGEVCLSKHSHVIKAAPLHI